MSLLLHIINCMILMLGLKPRLYSVGNVITLCAHAQQGRSGGGIYVCTYLCTKVKSEQAFVGQRHFCGRFLSGY